MPGIHVHNMMCNGRIMVYNTDNLIMWCPSLQAWVRVLEQQELFGKITALVLPEGKFYHGILSGCMDAFIIDEQNLEMVNISTIYL